MNELKLTEEDSEYISSIMLAFDEWELVNETGCSPEAAGYLVSKGLTHRTVTNADITMAEAMTERDDDNE